jgi:hypothetical protein
MAKQIDVTGRVLYSSYLSIINDRFMLLTFLEQSPDFPKIRFVKGDFMTRKRD